VQRAEHLYKANENAIDQFEVEIESGDFVAEKTLSRSKSGKGKEESNDELSHTDSFNKTHNEMIPQDESFIDNEDRTIRELNFQDKPIGLIEEEKEPPNAMFFENTDPQSVYEEKDDEEEDFPDNGPM
jgi:hypothetical protein